MYLEEIYLENTGPISKCHVKPPFADNGNPLPVVIVGPNGSGKSIFLSYIVDALMEFAKKTFRDTVPTDGLRTPYFRIVHPRAIRSGELFSLSLLHFKADSDDLYYYEKSGVLDPTTYSPDVRSVFDQVWKWPKDGNDKDILINKAPVDTEMQKGAHAFFPANRHEDPVWLNPKSLKVKMDAQANRRFKDELGKPLQLETCADENISWILDVLFDTAVDFDVIQKLQMGTVLNDREKMNWNNSQALQQSRQHIERILQAVVQDGQAKLQRRLRNNQEHRLAIQLGNGRVIPNLQSLSQGQSQLFHLFTTIIRYGERIDLNKSIRLSDITGLVIIDEIDAHLHPTLQHSIVPKLIKLFPKVQFIISSHSPLFLLGMEKVFGTDGVTILKLPDGEKISSEEYPEFRSTFEYYQTTERFEDEIKQLLAGVIKPTVLTEGKLDACYIHKALELLGKEKLLNSLEIRPVGNEGKKGHRDGGKSGLNRVLNFHTKDSTLISQPILLLYDWDANKDPDEIEKLWVRSIPRNTENTKVKKGIENLFPTDLFKECFYKTNVVEGDYGEQNTITEFKKKEFCQWICEERKNADDFEGFRDVVKILRKFFEAYQPHLD